MSLPPIVLAQTVCAAIPKPPLWPPSRTVKSILAAPKKGASCRWRPWGHASHQQLSALASANRTCVCVARPDTHAQAPHEHASGIGRQEDHGIRRLWGGFAREREGGLIPIMGPS